MTATGAALLPFEESPPLGPLRPRDEVLAAVIRRGRARKRRRQAMLASPIVAGSLTVVLVLSLAGGGAFTASVRTVPAAPGGPQIDDGPTPHGGTTATPGVPGAPPGAVPGPGSTAGTPGTNTGPGSNGRAPAAGTGSGPGGSPAPSQKPGNTTIGPCVARGTTSTTTPRACFQATDGPKGNYVGADPNARGCVVHNIGQYTAVRDDFFCQYDAVRPGGYITDGPFNLLRITRNGRTFDIDGLHAPRCEATGFILPGDHVYVDGRNDFSNPTAARPVPPAGYTTMSVGDVFHC